jgi:MFS family permease
VLGRGFWLLWSANVVSSLAAWSLGLVLAVDVVSRTGSASAVAGLVIASTAPAALLGGIVGGMADRVDRQRLLVVTSLVRLPVVAALAVAPTAPVTVLFVLVALDATARQVVLVAEQALLADLFAGPRQTLLPVATSWNSTGTNVTRLVAPPAGGVLLAGAGLAPAVWTITALLGIAALLLLVLASVVRVPRVPRAVRRPAIGEGFRVLRADPHLRAVSVLQLLDGVKEGALTSLFTVFMVGVVGAGAALVGTTNAIFAVGALVAAPLIPAVVRRWGYRAPIALGAVVSAAVLVPMLLRPGAPTALWGFALAGVPFTVSWVAAGTLLLLHAPGDRRALAVGSANAVWSAAMLVSAALAGFLGDRFGAVPVLLVAFAVQAAGGLVFALLCPRDQRSPTASRSQKTLS